MKRVDFGVECPECKVALHIPLVMERNKLITDVSHFDAECPNCITEFKVNIQISTEVVISSTLKC